MGSMSPTLDFLEAAKRQIRAYLEVLQPELLEVQGTIEHHLKSDNSAVTEMDTFVESELAKSLKELDATIPFGGEETGAGFGKPTFWLVDPIDGTEPFIRGLPFTTNMVSLIDGGEPVFGIIYDFNVGDFFVAIKGHGATCNGHGHEWDFAPGTLLVTEAGGRVANIGSDTYNFRKFNHVAATPAVFDKVMEFMTHVESNAKNTTA